MPKRKDKKEKKRIRTIASLSLLLIGFLVILLGMKFYQYFRAQDHFAVLIITETNQDEVEKLRDFFNDVNSKLSFIYDLGRNGNLTLGDTPALNRKFMPFLVSNKSFSVVILADEKGNEYFLYRNNGAWITRRTKVLPQGSKMVFHQWKSPNVPLKEWEENSDYDPRKQPWFRKPTSDRNIHWSPMYQFYGSKERGVTASVSWAKGGNKPGFMVCALDIPLAKVQEILALSENKTHGVLFLLNARKRYYITSREMDFLGVERSSSFNTKLLSHIVEKWKEEKQPVEKFISVNLEGKRWIASLLPLFKGKDDLWVGFAAPENIILSELRKRLFSIDSTDVAVALIGGSLLVFLFWKTGGFKHQTDEEIQHPIVRLHNYINEGEGIRVEFKSTVRTNLKTGKRGKEIELAWLKTVVAFLNSDGGALLIGVNDEGKILGVDADGFENNDKCLLHIKNLINQHIGAEFSGFLEVSLVDCEGKKVVMIECSAATEPVFLKIGKNEEFYIRSGPSSVKLLPSQMISYVLQNMKKRKI